MGEQADDHSDAQDAQVNREAMYATDQDTNAGEEFAGFQQHTFQGVFAVNPVSHSPQVRVFDVLIRLHRWSVCLFRKRTKNF